MSGVVILLIFFVGFPILFSVGEFILGFNLAKRFDFGKSFLLTAIAFLILFYVFRLFYVILWSVGHSYDGSFFYNFNRNYDDLFDWVDMSYSIYYVLDRRWGIHLPDFLYQNWINVSVMEILFYPFVGAAISFVAKLWRGKALQKFGGFVLLLMIFGFYLYVIVHWMYLAMGL